MTHTMSSLQNVASCNAVLWYTYKPLKLKGLTMGDNLIPGYELLKILQRIVWKAVVSSADSVSTGNK
jgi:hypothetical protein